MSDHQHRLLKRDRFAEGGWIHFCDHHMAIKRSFPECLFGSIDMTADLGHNGGAKGHVRDKVAVHDVDMEPVCALRNGIGTCFAQCAEIRAED